MKFLSNLDLRQNQLLNAVIENRTSHPEGAIPGQIYFNTQDKVFYGLTESNVWIDISNNFDSSAIEASIEAIEERLAELVGIEGKVAKNTEDITGVTGRVGTLETEVAGLNEELTSKVDKLTKEDKRIEGLVTAEASRAQSEEAKIREDFAAADSAQDLEIEKKANKSDVDAELLKKADKIHRHNVSEIDGLGSVARLEVGTGVGQVPVLGENGKLATDVLPSIAINEVVEVNSPEEALELNQEVGDMVILNLNSQQMLAVVEKYNADQINLAQGFKTTSNGLLNEEFTAYVAQGKTTYICVNPEGLTFEERYRPLNSVTDTMTKGEITAALNLKADKAQVALDIESAKNAAISEAERLSETVQDNLDAAKLELEGSISGVDTKVTNLTGRVSTNETEISNIKQAATTLGEKVTNHINDEVAHITNEERNSWNARARKFVATIGDGHARSFDVAHNFGDADVQVTVKEADTGMVVFTDVNCLNANKVVVSFAIAPTAGQYKVVVIG